MKCLTAAVLTICCSRCMGDANVQSCDLWPNFDGRVSYFRFKGGAVAAVLIIKAQKINYFHQGHQPRLGSPRTCTSTPSSGS